MHCFECERLRSMCSNCAKSLWRNLVEELDVPPIYINDLHEASKIYNGPAHDINSPAHDIFAALLDPTRVVYSIAESIKWVPKPSVYTAYKVLMRHKDDDKVDPTLYSIYDASPWTIGVQRDSFEGPFYAFKEIYKARDTAANPGWWISGSKMIVVDSIDECDDSYWHPAYVPVIVEVQYLREHDTDFDNPKIESHHMKVLRIIEVAGRNFG